MKKKSVRPIGRPMKHGHILHRLEDERLYTPATIAAIAADPLKEPKRYRRIRNAVASFSRRHYFNREGDGKILIPGQGLRPAWYGATWKEPVPMEDRHAREVSASHGAEPRPAGAVKSPPGRPMRYAALIMSLDPNRIHSPQTVAEGEQRKNFPSSEGDSSSIRKKKYLVRKSMQQFCKKMPQKPDGMVRGTGQFAYNGWYGWRWQVHLPDSVLSNRQKKAILVQAFLKRLQDRSRQLSRRGPDEAEPSRRKMAPLAALVLRMPLKIPWLAATAALGTLMLLFYLSLNQWLPREVGSEADKDSYIQTLANRPTKNNMKRMVDLFHEKGYRNQRDLIASKLTGNLRESLGRGKGDSMHPLHSPSGSGTFGSIKPSSVRLAGQPLFTAPEDVLISNLRGMDPLVF